jgi:uncharacterized integral membrane protein
MQIGESTPAPVTYKGQFGEFTITTADRQGVVIYRAALMVAAMSFGIGTITVLFGIDRLDRETLLNSLTFLATIFAIAVGIALANIHIYMVFLHRTLQLFWAIGCTSAIGCSFYYHQPIGAIVYQQPLTILGVGFIFAALTGIFFKEAFCFDRLETKLLVFIVPLLLLGHLTQLLPQSAEPSLLAVWAGLFLVFATRKVIQQIPPDIGDKSVFEYLAAQQHK